MQPDLVQMESASQNLQAQVCAHRKTGFTGYVLQAPHLGALVLA